MNKQLLATDELLGDLERNHLALGRAESIYSRAAAEIRRSHDFIREVAWRLSDYAAATWSGPDVLAHVADYFGTTVKEIDDVAALAIELDNDFAHTVNINLQRTPVCDRCCLAITKQTVATLTVRHASDDAGATTEIRSRVYRGAPV